MRGCDTLLRCMGAADAPPATCIAGAAPPARKRRNKNITAYATRPISTRLETISSNAPPKPKWLNKAAIPSPAAMPATGANQRDPPLRAAAVAAPAPAAVAAACRGTALLAAAGGRTAWRCTLPTHAHPPTNALGFGVKRYA